MDRASEKKIVLVTQKTRLEMLIRRYNTAGQAKFFIEHSGGDFTDYEQEHERYMAALASAEQTLSQFGRVQRLDRDYLTGFIFGADDIVAALGRDGLVANTMKYLDGQPIVGINPDPARWDGVLLPFQVGDLRKLMPEVIVGRRQKKSVTLAEAALSDGQTLCAVNDLFIGQKSHTSARYVITVGEMSEQQSSSGMLVSTGLGSTGWLKSVIAGAAGIAAACGLTGKAALPCEFGWSSEYLYYSVREPFPSRTTGTNMVFGKVDSQTPLKVTSLMPENGVIFSDGIEADCIEFNSGSTVTVTPAKRHGQMII